MSCCEDLQEGVDVRPSLLPERDLETKLLEVPEVDIGYDKGRIVLGSSARGWEVIRRLRENRPPGVDNHRVPVRLASCRMRTKLCRCHWERRRQRWTSKVGGRAHKRSIASRSREPEEGPLARRVSTTTGCSELD